MITRTASMITRFAIAVFCMLMSNNFNLAQPVGLPWAPDPVCNSIITTGIAAVTCGTTIDVPPLDQFTFGMININGALPAAGRVDVSALQAAYHHPSWRVDSIGNVFGITMDDCGNTYITASSNYGADFFGNVAIIKYGVIGGGPQSLSAAGTIYKIDGLTGQASVFSVLPQQAFSFTHSSCEGPTSVNRNTGPGLGNLFFEVTTKLFYVTNFEDGRIYRLDITGNILDSFDPLTYDNGAPGTPELNELAYGIAVSPDGNRLFFGTSGNSNISPGKIYSIDLNPDGSFTGTIDNSSLPAGATWDNFTGTETTHITVSSPSFFAEVLSASDMEFTPGGDLLVGARVGCFNIHTSYNHGGACMLLNADAGGIYNILESHIFTGYEFSIGGSSECYGGVSVFQNPDGSNEYVISSADILEEQGPHGICIIPEGVYGTTGNPASPAGAISYGVVDDEFNDPKGVGGDVKVFKECLCVITCPTEVIATASPDTICSGAISQLDYTVIGGNAEVEASWLDMDGNPVNPDSLPLQNTGCAPLIYDFILQVVCLEDTSIILSDTVSVTVFGTEVVPYVTVTEEPCEIALVIDEDCAPFFNITGDIPIINPGDTGTVTLQVTSIDPLQCASETFNLSYACPPCSIDSLVAIAQPCVDSFFYVQLDLEVANGSDGFLVTDQDGNSLGEYNYTDLPVTVGPLLGDSVTIYTLTVTDINNPNCQASITAGPQDCLEQCGDFDMPNAFSPNGDEINDVFRHVATGPTTVLSFKIFNRWGECVHDAIEPWDGNYNEKPQPTEVYLFIIIVDTTCEIREVKGDVTLIR
jgi:gliding motility-associated-like protein